MFYKKMYRTTLYLHSKSHIIGKWSEPRSLKKRVVLSYLPFVKPLFGDFAFSKVVTKWK